MPTATVVSHAPPRPLTAADLAPGPGVTPAGPAAFAVGVAHARLAAAASLPPGWYELTLAVQSADRFATRKRLEVTFDPADDNPRPAAREAFAWNRGFEERFVFHLTRPAAGLRVDLWDAEGTVTFARFDVRPVTRRGVVARAVREKVRLTRTYRCFGPALARGGRLVLTGRFREFGAKMIKGLTDARVLQLGTVGGVESDAAWWRRHALGADESLEVKKAVEAMPDPPTLAVLLPVDPERMDLARESVRSLFRQIYPHWELLVVAAGPPGLSPHLAGLVGTDKRAAVTRVPLSAGLPAAIAKAVTAARSEHVLVLPSGTELAEHALYYFADAVRADPAAAVGGLVHGKREDVYAGDLKESDADDTAGRVWLTATRRLRDAVPDRLTPGEIGEWVAGAVPAAGRTLLEPVLAYPAHDQRLFSEPPTAAGGLPLVLSGDLKGLTGYDHVSYALLKGLPTAGADLYLHPSSIVRPDLLPPGHTVPIGAWKPGVKQVVVSLPGSDPRWTLDRNTAVVTMWETDRLLPEWVARLNRAGLVVVPSRWGADCFRASGVTTPVAVAPLGYDPFVFHPGAVRPSTGVCTFGTAGALAFGGLRKNAQQVIDLFRRAFPAEPDVRLRVKITPNSSSLETYDDPRVEVLRAVLPPGDLAEWYRSLTAYVNLSAGEGFGLHMIEAMACGKPLVCAPYSGLTEYFDAAVGYPVDYALVPVDNEIYSGRWAEVDPESVIARLREVYADRAGAARLGEAAATRAQGFTWKASGRVLARVLREHGYLA